MATGSRARTRWSVLLVCVVAALCYANAVRGDFVFDDLKLIVNNDLVKSFRHVPDLLFSNLWGALGRGSNYYRPLPPLMFTSLHSLFGLRPEPFHLLNILLHAGATGLVFILARTLLARERPIPLAADARDWPALLAALLFAVHPLHVEAVAWISGVMDLGCAFFSLLALYLYIRSDDGPRPRVTYLGCLAALLLALLSKEPAATVPVLFALYDLLFAPARAPSTIARWRRWVAPAAVLALYLTLRTVALGGLAPFRTKATADLYTTVVNFPVLLSLYVQKLLVPTGLNVVYDLPPATSLLAPAVLARTACLGLVAIGVVWLGRKYRTAAFGACVLLLPLLPSLYLPALSQDASKAFAERYAYFPSAGLAVIVAAALAMLWSRRPALRLAAAAAVALVVATFAALTVVRNTVWKDSYSLWSDTVQKSPNLPLAHESLALALIRRGEVEAARRELDVALRLDPTLPEQSVSAGVLAARGGQSLQAILAFQTALAYRPDFVDARYNLALAYDGKGLTDFAMAEYQATLTLRPDHADAHNNLGILLAQTGRLDEAVAHFEASIRSRPDDAQVRLNLARAYELSGRPDLAETQRTLATGRAHPDRSRR